MSDYLNGFGASTKDATQAVIAASDIGAEFDKIVTAVATKTDKTIPTGVGNIATLTSSGNLADGGVAPTTYTKTILDDADAGAVKDTLLLATSVTITPSSDADVTITSTQATYGRLILANGSWTSGHNIIVPTNQRVYFVDNSGGSYNAVVKTNAGTGITVYAGTKREVVCDGTNVIDPLTYIEKTFLSSKIQPISATVGSNALTVTLNPTTLDFRSATLGSGAVTTLVVPSAISMTVSSGSTLGTVNAVKSNIVVLAINNAGTVELAVVNIAGTNNLDESTLISTTAEGGGGAADSATTIYSTTARTSVPFRVVGVIESTQATAGTWVTSPSKIQGAGGNALTAFQSLGYGQTITTPITIDNGVTYYNTSTRTQFLSVQAVNNTANIYLIGYIDGVASFYGPSVGANVPGYVTFPIPPGRSYSWNYSGGVAVSYVATLVS